MANLYEINQAILDCVDAETGEIISPEKLDKLTMEFNEKVDGIAQWIKNLESFADALEIEKDSFAERERAARNKAEVLKQYLIGALDGKPYNSTAASISFRRSTAVYVSDNAQLPDDYIRVKTTKEPNKTMIAKALKSGEEIPGCILVENQSIKII